MTKIKVPVLLILVLTVKSKVVGISKNISYDIKVGTKTKV